MNHYHEQILSINRQIKFIAHELDLKTKCDKIALEYNGVNYIFVIPECIGYSGYLRRRKEFVRELWYLQHGI